MRFFPHAGAAEAAGFRACRRCRPEASPGSPDWNVRADLAARAVRLIADGYADEHGISGAGPAARGHGPASAAAAAGRARCHPDRAGQDHAPADGAAPAGRDGDAGHRDRFRERVLQRPPVQRELPGSLRPAAIRAAAPAPCGAVPPPGGPATRARASPVKPGTAGHRPGRRQPGPPTARGLSGRRGRRDLAHAQARLPGAVRRRSHCCGYLAARAIPGVEEVSRGRYARTIRAPGGSGIIELVPGLIELTMPDAHDPG